MIMLFNEFLQLLQVLFPGGIFVGILILFYKYVFKIWIQKMTEGYIDSKFKKKDEEWKNHLQKDLEKYKQEMQFNNSRLSQDFNLWTTERHNVLAKLHHDMKVAQSAVFSLEGTGFFPDYSKLDRNEIEEELIKRQCLPKDISEVVDLWESNKNVAMQKFKQLNREYNIVQAFNQCNNAQNTLVDAELYLSKELYDYIRTVLIDIKCLWNNYDSFWHCKPFHYDEKIMQENEELKKKINNNWQEVVKSLHDELSGKYLENDNKTNKH